MNSERKHTTDADTPATPLPATLLQGIFPPAPDRSAPLLIAIGGFLGAIGDILLRRPELEGVSFPIFAALMALAVVVIHRRLGIALHPSRLLWLATGVLFTLTFVWRDASVVFMVAFWCALVCFALAAFRTSALWIPRSGVSRYLAALASGGAHGAGGALGTLFDLLRPGAERGTGSRRQIAGVARGVLFALPLLIVFGALLMSADAVFESVVMKALVVDLEDAVGHLAIFAFLGWVSVGYLRGTLTGTEPHFLRRRGEGARAVQVLGNTEVVTVLSVMNLLFLAFVVVQFRYLFGGSALVQVTPSLTYAEYARTGFAQLVLAVTLVLPVLLAADALLGKPDGKSARAFRVQGFVQVLLMLTIAASAVQRLRLYVESYGLTEARFCALALLVWIAAILVWLAATVLRGSRERFAFGALLSGLATALFLILVNPVSFTVRANIERSVSAPESPIFDSGYVATLSADAVPPLIAGLPRLSGGEQCVVAMWVLERWGGDENGSRQRWNIAAARAKRAVRENAETLRATADGSECKGR